ncbi:hypothetical protein IscW_ISCW006464 [Ixodes scapularis]|uniref:Uncharacterized protein n=1 Tax=Ixodes scapularis TaxID=6945 RepID=B7PMC2_IXOSC|nr:hypothetical protein IscW_ISCW006464 [Ixodes scapularis]|eukprot:XP_002434920.1 hypothetical protein IscW_ISCW006464 [Ixodes scapularis]
MQSTGEPNGWSSSTDRGDVAAAKIRSFYVQRMKKSEDIENAGVIRVLCRKM